MTAPRNQSTLTRKQRRERWESRREQEARRLLAFCRAVNTYPAVDHVAIVALMEAESENVIAERKGEAQASLQRSQGTLGAAGPKSRNRNGRPQSSAGWTQERVNQAVLKHVAKRSDAYTVASGKGKASPDAVKKAKKLFGRNYIAGEMVCPGAMVTNSPMWDRIKKDLNLRDKGRASGTRRTEKTGRQGEEIIHEAAAEAKGDTTFDAVVRNEQTRNKTVKMIRDVMNKREMEATIEKLERGEITDDQARSIVDACKTQYKDDKSRKIPKSMTT